MADQYLKTVLLYNAIIRNDFDLVKELLVNGANPNLITRDGASPMHIVVGLADTSISENLTDLLLKHHGNCNVKDPDGITPLAIACGFGRCEVVKTLLQHGGDPLIENNDRENCFDQAVLSGCDQCVAILTIHLKSCGKKPVERAYNSDTRQVCKKLPRRSSVMNYTVKVQSLINFEMEAGSSKLQLDVTSPDHPIVLEKSSNLEHSVDDHDVDCSSTSFHTVPSHGASPIGPTVVKSQEALAETPHSIETTSVEIPEILVSEKSVSVNNASSLDLSLDPKASLTITLNQTDLVGKLEDLTINNSSLGDETLREIQELMMEERSEALQNDRKFCMDHERQIHCEEQINGHCDDRNKENKIAPVKIGMTRTKKKSDVVLKQEDNARFSKKYYVPLSESNLYTDDESTCTGSILISRTEAKHIPSVDSGFGSPAKSGCSETPKKTNSCNKYQNGYRCNTLKKNRLFNDNNISNCPIVAEKANISETSDKVIGYIGSENSPTSIPVHQDFYCSPRTSSRCVSFESSTSSETSDHSHQSYMSVSPSSDRWSLPHETVDPDTMTSLLSGIQKLNNTARHEKTVVRSNIRDVCSDRDSQCTDLVVDDIDCMSKTRPVSGKDEVFCSSSFSLPDHSRSTTFDCPFVNTPERLKSTLENDSSLASQNKNLVKTVQDKCGTGWLELFKDETKERNGKHNDSLISTASKDSACSCSGQRVNRVYSDTDGGISLVEVCLSKDDQNCSIHSEKLHDKSSDSTLVLDWREQEEETNHSNHGSSTCMPTHQPGVKQFHLVRSSSFPDEEDSEHNSSCVSTASSVQVVISDEIKSLRDSELRLALERRGDTPGPITITTRKAYEIKLARLQSDPTAVAHRNVQDAFCPELRLALNGQFVMPSCDQLETSLAKMFVDPNPTKQWREGTKKTSFNYLLLDPRVTQNLPARVQNLTDEEGFEVFVKSVFYVGKGKRSRPYAHFKEAIRHITGKAAKDLESSLPLLSQEASKKVLHIVKIWEAGLGVVSLHVFQNIIPTEAYTREACLIEALSLKRLTNVQTGQFYENVASWSAKKKRQAGVILLKKAYKIFILEGERQIRAYDIKDIP